MTSHVMHCYGGGVPRRGGGRARRPHFGGPVALTTMAAMIMCLIAGSGCGSAGRVTAGTPGVTDPFYILGLTENGWRVVYHRRRVGESDWEARGGFRAYDGDGLLVMSGKLQHNWPHGDVKVWHPNGRLAAVNSYEEGQSIGTSRIWDEDGRLIYECPFHEHEKHGTETYWGAGGEAVLALEWDLGELLRLTRYQDGRPAEVYEGDDAEREFLRALREKHGYFGGDATDVVD